MSRDVWDGKIGGNRVIIRKLLPMKVLELGPDLVAILAPGLPQLAKAREMLETPELDDTEDPAELARRAVAADKRIAEAMAILAPAIETLARSLGGGKLAQLAPELLETVIYTRPVEVPHGKGTKMVVRKFELSGGADAINEAFADNVGNLLAVIGKAVMHSFAGFFSVPGLDVQSLTKTKENHSETSNPSTSDTGQSTDSG